MKKDEMRDSPGSHILIVPSAEADSSRLSLEWKETAQTMSEWPRMHWADGF